MDKNFLSTLNKNSVLLFLSYFVYDARTVDVRYLVRIPKVDLIIHIFVLKIEEN